MERALANLHQRVHRAQEVGGEDLGLPYIGGKDGRGDFLPDDRGSEAVENKWERRCVVRNFKRVLVGETPRTD